MRHSTTQTRKTHGTNHSCSVLLPCNGNYPGSRLYLDPNPAFFPRVLAKADVVREKNEYIYVESAILEYAVLGAFFSFRQILDDT